MKNKLKSYITELDRQIKNGGLSDIQIKRLKTNIEIFRHERLIHLIVTMTFALLTVISLGLAFFIPYFLPLFVLFSGLEIPYIFHYYALENGVQRLQDIYVDLIKESL